MKIPIITGYTASGKTELSLKIAEKFNVEIISADAFQVYQYMDIGTGKPSKDELETVKHHLIDILTPDEVYSAGIFFEMAEKLIEDILNRNKIPLIVGGTGLYIEVLTKGIFKAPELKNDIRTDLQNEIMKKGTEYFYNLLLSKDPEYGKKITKNDKNKIIRAFEIMEATGTTVSEAHKIYHRNPKYNYIVFIIEKERFQLYNDINNRVLKMFQLGWIDEVKNLLNLGYKSESHAFKAIGYREIASYLQKDNNIKERLIEEIQTKTRQFAKRQITWFRHMKGIVKLTPDKIKDIKEISKYLNHLGK
jgi:tRNA dimethylallyltransferase